MTGTRLYFAVVIFLGSFLLFLVEPIVAKQLVPVLGGSAAVWITCLVFFQSALLCAYAYAHWIARNPRWFLHIALLAAAVVLVYRWAFGSIDLSNGAEHPVTTIFSALTLWIGLPFIALGATSPLLQYWWSRVEAGPVPYKLFALSNLASLLALAAYPTLIEPRFTLHAQRVGWFCGFLFFAALGMGLTLRSRSAVHAASPEPAADVASIPAAPIAHKWLWFLLPMGACMQLAAITSYITSNLAAIPMLWILPLGVYLLTIILAFEFPRLLPRGIVVRFLAVMLAGVGYMVSQIDVTVALHVGIAFFLLVLFVAGLFLHSEAYTLRPERAGESTLFYLLFAAGGAAGSFIVALVFPALFSFNYDISVVCFINALLVLACLWRERWAVRLLWVVASVIMLVLSVRLHFAYKSNTIVAVRNFYAALRVKQTPFHYAKLRTLTNGTIQHGTQIWGSEEQRKTPTTYYAEDSGIGLALRYCCNGRARNIGVIGLGAGTIAAYGRPGDRIRFYEINPAVIPVAQNAFTFIKESGAQISFAAGDARTTLAREAPQQFNVLAVDAFSGDAIPLHLLTAQALDLYRHHLAPGGIIAYHISNQHVNLEPAIALLAQNAGMRAVRVSCLPNDARNEFGSTWIMLSDDLGFLALPEVAGASHPAELRSGLRLWTDDYSSLLPLLRW
jgi:predicted O-methyltransferase YrrM